VAWSRAKVGLANKFLSQVVTCPCCGWRGRRFYDYIEVGYSFPNAYCPQCGSQPRHRSLYLWLQDEFFIGEKEGTALVFAPEAALNHVWDSATNIRVIKVDMLPDRGVELLTSLENLAVYSNSIDLVWCHHVLEHIERDRLAIGELHRVLRAETGKAIISVPMHAGEVTEEYGFADNRQSGHWRLYGQDFVNRLREGGFSVQTIDRTISPALRREYGIAPERFYVCRKIEDRVSTV